MSNWHDFEKYFFRDDRLGMSVDCSNIGLSDDFFIEMSSKIKLAYRDMLALEAGAIANIDENRMVGHYWLRNSNIAPADDIQSGINAEIAKVLSFVEKVHLGHISGQRGKFTHALLIGIGGSALGPQLICESLGGDDKIKCVFMDNTDPDGIDMAINRLAGKLGQTVVVVTSKSGSTPEPRNAMLEVNVAYERAGLTFARHAVAITGTNSQLDNMARAEGWLERFAMWDWVGGRTSIFSSVGLLPAALQGRDIKSFLAGGRDMDSATRVSSPKNPAMMMALAWYLATNGVGKKDMVVIPYKDRLANFS
jgi:glucose-6-phosphate isomerase